MNKDKLVDAWVALEFAFSAYVHHRDNEDLKYNYLKALTEFIRLNAVDLIGFKP